MDLSPDFRDLLEELARDAVECAIVGGYAVAFRGRPRATNDIDILLDEDVERGARSLEGRSVSPDSTVLANKLAERQAARRSEEPYADDELRELLLAGAGGLHRDARGG